MRYLFVTVDSAGALHPQLALAQRLRSLGHGVRFLGCRSQREDIARAGFEVRAYRGSPDFDMRDREGVIRDWLDDPATAFRACCDHIWFGPAAEIAADVLDDVAREPVDALVMDYFAFGAAIAGEKLGVPVVVLWHTGFGEWPSWELGLPALNDARARFGLPPDGSVYGSYQRAERVLVLTTERFDFALGEQAVPSNLRYVGPQLPPGEEPQTAPRRRHDPPSILVSLGTSYQAQEDLMSRVLGAIEELPVRALVTTGPAVTVSAPAAGNIEVLPWLPHTQVLPRTDLVVTHAGLGTVMNAMAFGVPLLCLPIGRDQHGNAARVSRLGFGLTADPSSDAEALRHCISAALSDTRLGIRARELATECSDQGYDAAALELEAAASHESRQRDTTSTQEAAR